MQDSYTKHRETIFITILALLLITVLLISKFALGINLGLLKNSYHSLGYQEIREDGMWALSFGSFDGQVNTSFPIRAGGPKRLILRYGTKSGEMRLHIESGEFEQNIALQGDSQEIEIPAGSTELSLQLDGERVVYGYLGAILE